MDEQEYKNAYNRINTIKCVFEKAMCSLHSRCSQGQMFRLADRHGYGCHSPVEQQQCASLLDHLRKQTRFVFKLTDIEGPLPHNKEIRVQNGGLLGLQKLLDQKMEADRVEDVSSLIRQVIERYGDLQHLPYDRIMQSVMAYQARPKRRSSKD
ncbi:MAG: hypothetical protein EP315_09025 [Gammaproteobacteria bacterium]|nr:MAG: hypothetical protein EP315_09025 [Gammaproteobacteria bacterium]